MIDTGIAAISRICATGAEHAGFGFRLVALQKGTLRAFPIAGVRRWRIRRRAVAKANAPRTAQQPSKSL